MEISVLEFKELLAAKNIKIIDIREHYLFERDHIMGSINLPKRLLKRLPSNYLNKHDTYYLICETGYNSVMLASYLTNLGYTVFGVNGSVF